MTDRINLIRPPEVRLEITYCEPHAAHSILKPDPQFFRSHATIAHARANVDGDGDVHHGTNLAHSDTGNMHVFANKLAASRRRATPIYGVDDAAARRLIVAMWTRRAHGRCVQIPDDADSQKQLLAKAQCRLNLDVAELQNTVDQACHEFTHCSDPVQRQKLAERIRHYDAEILSIRSGPGRILRILQLYYKLGWDSCRVAEELHMRSTAVRQILHRAGIVWNRLQCPARKNRDDLQYIEQRRRCSKLYRARKRLQKAEVRLAEIQLDQEIAMQKAEAEARRRAARARNKIQARIDEIWTRITPALLE